MKRKLALLLGLLAFSLSSNALERIGRLGVGFANQMAVGIPSISFKLQRSEAFAFGGQVGYSNDDNGGGSAAAIKVYRNFFDEPHLTFFGSLLGGIINEKRGSISESGFQADVTLGSEFSFPGLESLGFSLEFGLSFNKLDEFVVETVGNNFIVSAVHFYL
ncbi:MAG: hypothetical protein VXV96_17005 [Bdellovibrionota bacterium]|jgi:hypothetical protein|nr:hypothetical protein [Bdellovibrionota bacterium]